jgi:hypothetical protein
MAWQPEQGDGSGAGSAAGRGCRGPAP